MDITFWIDQIRAQGYVHTCHIEHNTSGTMDLGYTFEARVVLQYIYQHPITYECAIITRELDLSGFFMPKTMATEILLKD